MVNQTITVYKAGEGGRSMLLHVIAAVVCVNWKKKNSNCKRLLKVGNTRLCMNSLSYVPSALRQTGCWFKNIMLKVPLFLQLIGSKQCQRNFPSIS